MKKIFIIVFMVSLLVGCQSKPISDLETMGIKGQVNGFEQRYDLFDEYEFPEKLIFGYHELYMASKVEFDENGRVSKIVEGDVDLDVQTFEYDRDGYLIRQQLEIESMDYLSVREFDHKDDQVIIKDGVISGKGTINHEDNDPRYYDLQHYYDDSGHIVKYVSVREDNVYTIEYTYDDVGYMTKMTKQSDYADETLEFEYDNGLMTSYTLTDHDHVYHYSFEYELDDHDNWTKMTAYREDTLIGHFTREYDYE